MGSRGQAQGARRPTAGAEGRPVRKARRPRGGGVCWCPGPGRGTEDGEEPLHAELAAEVKPRTGRRRCRTAGHPRAAQARGLSAGEGRAASPEAGRLRGTRGLAGETLGRRGPPDRTLVIQPTGFIAPTCSHTRRCTLARLGVVRTVKNHKCASSLIMPFFSSRNDMCEYVSKSERRGIFLPPFFDTSRVPLRI